MKRITQIFFLLASLMLITICRAQSATTTIVIDDFSTAKGNVFTFNTKDGNDNCFSSYACTYELTKCASQSSSSILGGKRVSNSYVIVGSGSESDPTTPSNFDVSIQGDVSVSNQSWSSSLNITNLGTSSWFGVTYTTQIGYIRDIYCNGEAMPTPINLKKGGGNYIAFSVETDSSVAIEGIRLSVEDVNSSLGYAFADASYYDSDIGQYIVEMNLAEDDVDVDFTQVTYIEVQVSATISYPLYIDPNDFYSINVGVSDLRVVSIGGNNDGYSSLSSGSSKSSGSTSSRSSGSSGSSNDHSSDCPLINPVTSLLLLLCIFVLLI